MAAARANQTTLDDMEIIRRFTLWAFQMLKVDVDRESEDVFSFCVPERDRHEFGDAALVRFGFAGVPAPTDQGADTTLSCVTADSKLLEWLLRRLKQAECVAHSAPQGQASSVHDLTTSLYRPYLVDGGRVQVGGCTLEDRPFLRLTYRVNPPDHKSRLTHFIFGEDGRLIDGRLAAALKLDDLAPATRRSHDLTDKDLHPWVERGKMIARQILREPSGELIAVTVVWCKFAEGKLVFQIGAQAVETAFQGWAQLLADGLEMPPPYRCELCDRQSYHLAATDDGRITVADAMVKCSESDAKVLPCDLETCEVTGRRASPQYLETCPVTGSRVLRSQLVICQMCDQRVSPLTIQEGRCLTCRQLKPISKNDPRIARVLSAYPALDRWRSWHINESSSIYVLAANSILKRLLLVLDKNTLELRRFAMGHRLTRAWTEVPETQQRDYLQRGAEKSQTSVRR